MVIKRIQFDQKCNNCGKKWKQKGVQVPKFCPRCHSEFYNYPHKPGTVKAWKEAHPEKL